MNEVEVQKRFKKVLVIISIIFIIIISILGFLFYRSTVKNNEMLSDYQSEIKTLKNKNKNLEEENQLVIQNNTSPTTETNKEMYKTIDKVFSCFYNYDNSNYTTREKNIENDLSEKMRKQLFPQNVKNYMGNITSKMIKLTTYSNAFYEKVGNKEAIVEVKYKSKYAKQSYQEHTAVWKVQYDSKEKMITNIEEMGMLTESGD